MKKRILSLMLTLCMILVMLPMTAFAAGNIAEVTRKDELTAALADDSITEIHVTGDITFTDSLNASKVIEVEQGVTLTIGGDQTTVSGTIVNNGTIKVTSTSKCTWKAATSGSGKLVAANTRWGEYQTYVDYGCVPESMMENCKINIVKDISVRPTVSLPENMQVGDTIAPTVTNLIDDVDMANVFKYTWKNGNGSEVYNGAANPTLTAKGNLSLNLAAKKPYVMCSPSGSYGSMDGSGTVAERTLDVVYVDSVNGSNSNIGDSASTALKTIGTAADKVNAGGRIVLCGDYSGTMAYIEKDVTIQSNSENTVKLTLSGFDGLMIAERVSVTLDHINMAETTVSASGSGSDRAIIFSNCTGTIKLTNGNAQFGSVTLNSSNLSGYLYAADSLTMNASTFSGQFATKDFVSTGSSKIISKKVAPARIDGTITTESPVTITPANLTRGEKLIEVAKDSSDAVVDHFVLANSQNGKYVLKCRNRYNGRYIGVSERVASKNVRFAVADEPVIGDAVPDPDKTVIDIDHTKIDSASISVSAVWSGYTDKNSKKWSLGDYPKLTITLNTDVSDDPFSHFDDGFDVSELGICSWADNEMARYDDELLNKAVTCGERQISGDGRTLTFTVSYPEVTRLSQEIKVDTSDRTANCGDVLEAREASAQSKITYESSDPEIASVDPETGEITVHKAGEVMITLRAEQTDIYEAAEAEYKLIVTHKFSDDWKHDDKEHWKECVCGEKSEVGSHSGGKADTTHKAKCSVCGTEYGELAKADNTQKKNNTKNSGTQQNNNRKGAVKTGDYQPVMIWAMLFLISGMAVTVVMLRKRKGRA